MKEDSHVLVAYWLKCHINTFEGAGVQPIAEWEPVVLLGRPLEVEMQNFLCIGATLT